MNVYLIKASKGQWATIILALESRGIVRVYDKGFNETHTGKPAAYYLCETKSGQDKFQKIVHNTPNTPILLDLDDLSLTDIKSTLKNAIVLPVRGNPPVDTYKDITHTHKAPLGKTADCTIPAGDKFFFILQEGRFLDKAVKHLESLGYKNLDVSHPEIYRSSYFFMIAKTPEQADSLRTSYHKYGVVQDALITTEADFTCFYDLALRLMQGRAQVVIKSEEQAEFYRFIISCPFFTRNQHESARAALVEWERETDPLEMSTADVAKFESNNPIDIGSIQTTKSLPLDQIATMFGIPLPELKNRILQQLYKHVSILDRPPLTGKSTFARQFKNVATIVSDKPTTRANSRFVIFDCPVKPSEIVDHYKALDYNITVLDFVSKYDCDLPASKIAFLVPMPDPEKIIGQMADAARLSLTTIDNLMEAIEKSHPVIFLAVYDSQIELASRLLQHEGYFPTYLRTAVHIDSKTIADEKQKLRESFEL